MQDAEYAKNYVCHEYEVYTYIMIVIAGIREINEPLNEKATLLAGKPVNGNVCVAMYKKPEYNEQPPYVGLSISTLENILKIRQKSSSLTTNMEKSHSDYVNFEKILELEYVKHGDIPGLNAVNISGELLNIGKQ